MVTETSAGAFRQQLPATFGEQRIETPLLDGHTLRHVCEDWGAGHLDEEEGVITLSGQMHHDVQESGC